MAGVSVDGEKGGKRKVDAEINMIPMIDLLMVTISFLLITAVWSHSSRLEANASAPSNQPTVETPPVPEKKLHVERKGEEVVLSWRLGTQVVGENKVACASAKAISACSELKAAIEREWQGGGLHREASDRKSDEAVLHAAHDAPYSDVVAMLDAIATPQRKLQMTPGRAEQ
jgi:biopolymer transport protein ExbD